MKGAHNLSLSPTQTASGREPTAISSEYDTYTAFKTRLLSLLSGKRSFFSCSRFVRKQLAAALDKDLIRMSISGKHDFSTKLLHKRNFRSRLRAMVNQSSLQIGSEIPKIVFLGNVRRDGIKLLSWHAIDQLVHVSRAGVNKFLSSHVAINT